MKPPPRKLVLKPSGAPLTERSTFSALGDWTRIGRSTWPPGSTWTDGYVVEIVSAVTAAAVGAPPSTSIAVAPRAAIPRKIVRSRPLTVSRIPSWVSQQLRWAGGALLHRTRDALD